MRTRAEWDYVGRIPGAVEIELLTYPGRRPNPGFVAELERQVDKTAPVLFICRSGGRSHNAAHARARRPATPTPTTCSKVSKATATTQGIAIPSAGGAPQDCRGRSPELNSE